MSTYTAVLLRDPGQAVEILDLETARIRQDLPDPVTRAASVRVTMN